MAALSKLIKCGDFSARIQNRCQQVEGFELDEQSILRIGQFEILNNFASASAALRKSYFLHKPLAIVGGNCMKEGSIDLSTENFFDITNVSYGMSVLYHPAQSVTEFVNVQSATAHEQLKSGRYWLFAGGEDKILTFQGSDIVTANQEKTLNVWAVRYPDVSMLTLEETAANTKFMDIPDWAINLFYISIAVSAIKEQNLAVPQNIGNEVTAILGNLSDKLTSEEIAATKARLDNPTR